MAHRATFAMSHDFVELGRLSPALVQLFFGHAASPPAASAGDVYRIESNQTRGGEREGESCCGSSGQSERFNRHSRCCCCWPPLVVAAAASAFAAASNGDPAGRSWLNQLAGQRTGGRAGDN